MAVQEKTCICTVIFNFDGSYLLNYISKEATGSKRIMCFWHISKENNMLVPAIN